MKTKLLVTGLTGLVGSRFEELLNEAYELQALSRASGVDILDKTAVTNAISSSDAQIVLHMAGKTHVDGCELDKPRDKEILEMGSIVDQEAAWKSEIDRRIRDIQAGRVEGIPLEDSLARIRKVAGL